MQTPSLRSRLTWVGIGLIGALVLGLDAFVYLNLREQLEENLDQVLDARLQLAGELVQTLEPPELEQRLAAAGVPARISLPNGLELESSPATTRAQIGPPAPSTTLPAPLVSAQQTFPGDITVTVFASRAGVDRTLDEVLLLETIASIIAIGLSVVVLQRVSSVALRPIDRIVSIARRSAAGRAGGRLNPDRPETELGRMAVAFDEMLDALETAVADARASEEQSRRFLADAAHQLRTPITGIRASVETLMRTPDGPERERLLDHLARESSRVGQLVSSLLRMAQLDRRPELMRARVSLRELVAAEVDRLRRRSPDLTVALECPPELADLEIAVEADSIAEALANLLDNARRHARSEVRVRLAMGEDWIAITVADDGPGLPEDRAAAAFDRFVSLDGGSGSGLGLPIARSVARAHGGDVDWTGEVFRLRLPASARVDREPTDGADGDV